MVLNSFYFYGSLYIQITMCLFKLQRVLTVFTFFSQANSMTENLYDVKPEYVNKITLIKTFYEKERKLVCTDSL